MLERVLRLTFMVHVECIDEILEMRDNMRLQVAPIAPFEEELLKLFIDGEVTSL